MMSITFIAFASSFLGEAPVARSGDRAR
jgi:hypothetical protein